MVNSIFHCVKWSRQEIFLQEISCFTYHLQHPSKTIFLLDPYHPMETKKIPLCSDHLSLYSVIMFAINCYYISILVKKNILPKYAELYDPLHTKLKIHISLWIQWFLTNYSIVFYVPNLTHLPFDVPIQLKVYVIAKTTKGKITIHFLVLQHPFSKHSALRIVCNFSSCVNWSL